RPQEALVCYRQAVGLLEPLVRDNPVVTEWRRNLYQAYYYLGGHQAELGHLAEARTSLRAALEHVGQLLADDAESWPLLLDQAGTRVDLGNVEKRLGNAVEARQLAEDAASRLDQLARRLPDSAHHRHRLGQALHGCALLLWHVGRKTDALSKIE